MTHYADNTGVFWFPEWWYQGQWCRMGGGEDTKEGALEGVNYLRARNPKDRYRVRQWVMTKGFTLGRFEDVEQEDIWRNTRNQP